MNLPGRQRPLMNTCLYGACDYVRAVLRPSIPWDHLGWRGVQEFRDGRSYVYFVGGDAGRIKIGLSESPMERLATFHLGSPIDLRFLLLIEGARKDEQRYHKKFAHLRVRGEWFDRSPELLAFISRTRSRQLRALRGTRDPCDPLAAERKNGGKLRWAVEGSNL